MWTRAALESEAHPWQSDVWRVVDSQAQVSTMKLVDTLAEQMLLESVLDRSKPTIPPSCGHLHYLLATPFRYSPYPTGSRFRRAGQPDGCYYASCTPETAIAEQAFYRFLFFLESPDTIRPRNAMEHTAFSVPIATARSIDRSAPTFRQWASQWMHPTDYNACQALADTASAAGIEALRYCSVRDPGHGQNVAVFAPEAFQATKPEDHQTWRIFVQQDAVQVFREMPYCSIEFRAERWIDDPRIAQALARP